MKDFAYFGAGIFFLVSAFAILMKFIGIGF